MKLKIGKLQILRHIVQIIMFFLLPGLYMLAFGELKGLYISVVNGSFEFPYALYGLTELLIILVFTISFGRFFCGWACAFGTYGDFLHELSSRLLRVRFRIGAKADRILKYLKYVVLVFLIIFIWTTGSTAFSGSSPWDAFASVLDIPETFGILTIGFVLLLFITIGSLLIERFFCRYLCPLGALLAIASRINIIKLTMPKDGCRSCRVCTNGCSMGIELNKVDNVRGGECISCMKCVQMCPRKNAKASVLGQQISAPMVSAFALAAGVGLYASGQLGSDALKESREGATATVLAAASENGLYEDGTYTGSGTGFRGQTTTMSITIENGIITDIDTVSTGDDREFYIRAEDVVVSDILRNQSTDVDAVTGATYSRDGIIEAVEEALAKAGGTDMMQDGGAKVTEDDGTAEEPSEGGKERKGKGKNEHSEV